MFAEPRKAGSNLQFRRPGEALRAGSPAAVRQSSDRPATRPASASRGASPFRCTDTGAERAASYCSFVWCIYDICNSSVPHLSSSSACLNLHEFTLYSERATSCFAVVFNPSLCAVRAPSPASPADRPRSHRDNPATPATDEFRRPRLYPASSRLFGRPAAEAAHRMSFERYLELQDAQGGRSSAANQVGHDAASDATVDALRQELSELKQRLTQLDVRYRTDSPSLRRERSPTHRRLC